MKRGWILGGLLAILAACESTAVPKTDVPESPDPTLDAGTDGTSPPPAASPKLGPIGKQAVVIGKTATFRITVERGGLTGPLEVAFAGLPAGVTAKVDPIAAEASFADVTLSAAETAAFGTSKASVRVGKDAALSAAFDVEVRGVPGTLDKSFGVEGIALVGDGKNTRFVVAGDGSIVRESFFGEITKYRPGGTLDTTFADQGTFAIAGLIGGGLHGNTPAIPTTDAAGNIFAGFEYGLSGGTGTPRGLVIKLSARGVPDPGFGTNGVVHLPNLPEGWRYNVGSVTLLTDGSVLVESDENGTELNQYTYRLRRITKEGVLDTTFGTRGDGSVAPEGGRLVEVRYSATTVIRPTPGGGFYLASLGDALWQWQWTKDGAIDTSFGLGAGYTRTPNFLSGSAARLLAKRPNGVLDIGYGEGRTGRTNRYTATGIADSSYVSRPTQLPAHTRSRGVLADAAGRTYFGFQDTEQTIVDVWRLLSDGMIDGSFNGTGKFRIVLPQSIVGLGASLMALHELPDGRIVGFIHANYAQVAFRFWP